MALFDDALRCPCARDLHSELHQAACRAVGAVDTLVFDKMGALTLGTPETVAAIPYREEEISTGAMVALADYGARKA
jgi:high-affinity K+ transport system ATPase subunit B